jgi:tetratricopeptide (TPR) repeat protein
MNDWERVQELFLMTVELPAEEQTRFLDSVCLRDERLRRELESLLASDCDSGAAIAEAVQGEAALLLDSEPLTGRRVGAYRIVREIGRGGMGAVYLATRDDAEFQKQVAIKVVKPGMDTTEVLDRFRYERQILANLDHPYIARLFDGGRTDEGLPYFVMEHIEGRPVSEYCRANTLSNRARCELFLRILEAVSYAHRNLVVHRDLKPGNIFVTPDGTPKLLDFGVAKVVGGIDGSHTMTALMRPFTPEYASPEQVLGLSVTTSTDIYSLGAVLYELLTDRRAQPITTPTPSEVERVVCALHVPRPSQIAPSVDADLDNIVMMAMRKEPERRYQSADQFADDIQRYLGSRPILARQDSVVYRLRKFVVRNRLEIAMAIVLVAGLTVGMIVAIFQARRAERALRVAESQRLFALHESAHAKAETERAEVALGSEARQREIAQQQTAVAQEQRDVAQHETVLAEQRLTEMLELAGRTLFDVHDAVAKLPGSIAARKEIVKTTLDYLERLQKESGFNDEMRIALAAAYYKVSLIQGNPFGPSLQDFAGAEASLLKGRDVIAPLYDRRSNDPDVMMRWLEIETGLADLTYQADKYEEAIKTDLDLLPIARRLALASPGDPIAARQEATIENSLALAYLRSWDSQHLGLVHAQHGLTLMRGLLSRYPDDAETKQNFGSLLAVTAGTLKNAGELDEAAEYYQQSIKLREDLLKANPNDTQVRRSLIVAYGNYASILGIPWSANLGRPAEARVYCAKAVALARESVRADSQDATARFDLAMALGRLGMVDPPPGGVKDSLANLQEAFALVEPLAKANPKTPNYADQMALNLEYQGHRYEGLGQARDAIQSYRKSMEVLQPFLDAGPAGMMTQELASEDALARAYASIGDKAAAMDYATHAVEQAEKRNAKPPPDEYHAGALARAYTTLAVLQEKSGDHALARQSVEKALDIWKQTHNRGALSIYSGSGAEAKELLAGLDAGRPLD